MIRTITILVLADDVNQPQIIWGEKNGPATLECSHKEQNYDQIYWYKQQPQSPDLIFIGYIYGTSAPKYEGDFKDKVKMVGDGKTSLSLTIKDLSASDSAVYFCAAYYTVLPSDVINTCCCGLHLRRCQFLQTRSFCTNRNWQQCRGLGF
uniref:Ig-like domain-containing protein n=1 Tax=Astyanax mexicanus TaxID=7994 RepID=A0A8B9L2Y9_ASTMX